MSGDKIYSQEEFDKKHNPLYVIQSPTAVYPGLPVAKGTVRFLITSGQNGTPVMAEFWQSLLNCQMHYKAHLSVIPYRYKNPTSSWSASQQNAEWWDSEIREFLCNTRRNLNPNIVVIGDVKIVPTAKDPLMGFEGHTGAESSIIGHPNLAFTSVATPGHKMAKIMTTTGTCTVDNYSDTRAGKQGLHQHVLGAVIVEIEGSKFWLRHLNANKKGEFIDMDKLFTPKGVFNAPRPEALVTGDAHVKVIDKTVDRAVFGKGGVVERMKPKRIFFHDLFDGLSVNPYHSPLDDLAQIKAGNDDVEKEVRESVQFVIDRTPDDCESVIVDSNHDAFLKKWIETKTWQQVGLNGKFYLETAKYLWENTHTVENVAQIPSPFKYWVDKLTRDCKKGIRCLREDESYSVCGIELGMHGHRGTNGARGSLMNLVKIGVKFIIGHVHSPGIRLGGMAVGLMALFRQGYNKGPSSWLHTMAVVHGGTCAGKRQLFTIIEDRYRL